MDEFTYRCFAPECDLLWLSVEHWKTELGNFRPDFVFIESAWRGRGGEWATKVANLAPELEGILAWCDENQVKTIFWNKEDPVHFHTFLRLASRTHFVATTDVDKIGAYKAALGHERVMLLPFACQPKTHNPIETEGRKNAFCFAGAYYRRYPQRNRDLHSLVEHLLKIAPIDIFDRNLGGTDPNYMFPDEYRPFVVGTMPPEQIHKCYKAYRYGVNLNSVKSSHSMFARRVFELIASNTLVVSNYARGMKLLFGDLVVASDSGDAVAARLTGLDPDQEARLRLAGLRKVLSEHTYAHRLVEIAGALGIPCPDLELPSVTVIGHARSPDEAESLFSHVRRQTIEPARVVVVVPDNQVERAQSVASGNWTAVPESLARRRQVQEYACDGFVACMAANDYYGPNYLADLLLATRYSDATRIGKGAHFALQNGEARLQCAEQSYRERTCLHPCRAICRVTAIEANSLYALVEPPCDDTSQSRVWTGLAIDPYNYCSHGSRPDGGPVAGVSNCVDDLPDIDTGLPIDALRNVAHATVPVLATRDRGTFVCGRSLAGWAQPSLFGPALPPAPRRFPGWLASLRTFKKKARKTASTHGPPAAASGCVRQQPNVQSIAIEDGWHIRSSLEPNKHAYVYLPSDRRIEDLTRDDKLRLRLSTDNGVSIRWLADFLDENKKRIRHEIIGVNENHTLDVPAGTAWVRFAARVFGPGEGTINGLLLGEQESVPIDLISRSRTLLLTNHYPSYDDIYRNAFVHSRVKAYRDAGVDVDVFRLRNVTQHTFHEFEGVECLTGSQGQLDSMLGSGRYDTVLVHFLAPPMWDVLRKHLDHVRVVVWVHGAEVQPWWRRAFSFSTDAELSKAKAQSEARVTFWRSVLRDFPANLHLVFVSKYLHNEVLADIGVSIPDAGSSAIHNPIDTSLFTYVDKAPEQRKKILSIRPFASRIYANDLTVKAILFLRTKPYFDDLAFRIIGQGPLFAETVAPLRELPNVSIEETFLRQAEIARLHREYGIFLVPSRMDSQGVSRDEAMSSGLVPVTNRVAAIPEFIDDSCGFLAEPEDAEGLAQAIARLYEDPELFLRMSAAAAARVRRQSDVAKVIAEEIRLFTHA